MRMTKAEIIEGLLDPGLVAVVRVDSAATLLGVSTVLDPETCRAAILAGAQFVVTPCAVPRSWLPACATAR